MVRLKSLVFIALLFIVPLGAQIRPGGGERIPKLATVATLSTGYTGQLAYVTDGTSASDCTVGGAATKVLCEYNGAAWTAVGGAGGGGTVTSVSFPTIPSWLTASVATATTTPAISITLTAAQTSHQVIGTCGSGTTFAPCALVAGDLPNIPVAGGGTGATTQANAAIAVFPTATRGGDITYWDGSIWNHLAGNNSGTNVLQENASGVPSWVADSTNASTVNGASVPASAALVGTNSSNQIILATPFLNNAQTGTYQVLAADFTNYKTITVASGTFTITLVASGSQPANGNYITILNYGTGVVTLARSGQNINGAAANLTGTAGSATAPSGWRVYSDGTNYFAEVVVAGTVTTTGSPVSGDMAKFSGGTSVTTAVAGTDFVGGQASVGVVASSVPRATAGGLLADSKLTCTASPVTCTAYDDTPSTGATQLTIREGAGQSATSAFQLKDSGGTVRVSSAQSIFKVTGIQDIGVSFVLGGSSNKFASAQIIGFTSNTNVTSAANDTGIARNAAGIIEVNNGSACSTASNCRDIAARSVISKGTVPGISGCSAGTQTGGGTAGTYSSGTTGTCTVTLTFALTAPTGWACFASDRTTAADLQTQTASTTTTATLAGTTVSGDVISFGCMAY